MDLYINRSRDFIVKQFALQEFLGERNNNATLDEIKQELLDLKSGNISNDEFEQHIIDSVDKGVDLSEIERIESIIESFDGD